MAELWGVIISLQAFVLVFQGIDNLNVFKFVSELLDGSSNAMLLMRWLPGGTVRWRMVKWNFDQQKEELILLYEICLGFLALLHFGQGDGKAGLTSSSLLLMLVVGRTLSACWLGSVLFWTLCIDFLMLMIWVWAVLSCQR